MSRIPSPGARRALTCFCAVSLMLLVGCRNGDAQKKAAAPPPPPEVLVQAVQPATVPLRTELPGRTAASMVAEVRPQVGGIIRARPFVEGSTVKAGQVLYEIDARPFEAEVQRAEGALANAQATVASTRALAERYRQLLPQNAVSRQEHDNAIAAYEQAQANVKVQSAALNTARINLQFTRVTAPIGGRTSRSAVTPGALVSAAQATPLLTISQLNPIYVDIAQSSAEILRLRQALATGRISREGDSRKVALMLEDGSRYAQEGRIKLAEVTVDPSSASVTLRAEFPNPDGLLLPGMYVRAVVDEGTTPQGIVVPASAIQRDRRGNPTVRVVGDGDKLEVRPVVTSRAVGTGWLVAEGLKAGDRLVLEGAQNAQAGAAVRVKMAPAGGAASAAAGAAPAGQAPARDAAAAAGGRPDAASAAAAANTANAANAAPRSNP
ncbi:efflux RND transporter periplasmic adaptor subunit [uncultured Pseudacidovorax sp.]|uniref:efflux RND transporter periplasmic adaptor subunit n=1 Tax=uncultured Pseudacidovorax sp. TaxID=679313 RepID=UPI0025D5CD55|nr:efflux RND transporter periplasmic adaptor subunit [uncultured Pseudacidovorax sp.]